MKQKQILNLLEYFVLNNIHFASQENGVYVYWYCDDCHYYLHDPPTHLQVWANFCQHLKQSKWEVLNMIEHSKECKVLEGANILDVK